MYIPQHEQRIGAYLLIPSSKYARARRKLIKKKQLRQSELKNTLETLRTHPYHPFLKTHHLTMANDIGVKMYASSVNWMYRLLWYFGENNRIILHNVGPHSGFGGVY